MKKITLLFHAALLALGATFAPIAPIMAQAGAAARATTDNGAVAATLENLRVAMLSADRAALTGIAAEKLVYAHSSGRVENKGQFVETIAGGDSVFVTLQFADIAITVSDGTAIVTHKFVADTNDRGKGPARVSIGVMLVFQKQAGGAWKLLGRQAFRL
jgi:ketosteroid isomerase-like protein